MRMDRPDVVAVCAGALALALLGGGAGAVEGPTKAEIRTPLHELGLGRTFVVRAVETRSSAPAVTIVATFLDGLDRVIKTSTGVVSPGHPATFRLTRADLPTDQPSPVARAVVVASRDAGFADNQTLLDFDFVDRKGSGGCGGTCSICSREGLSCAPPDPGHAPSVVCEGPAVVFTSEP